MVLTCKWSQPSCSLFFETAEGLFNHLCDAHVGRKRHGNLSLSCSWEGCDHKAAKRDHMTSHMMVHCPLQTNVCGICEKTFKRSYDLRKHEITHTAEHHQAHGRSRAVIYKDLQLPFSTRADLHLFPLPNEGYTSVKPSRTYTLPRGRSTEVLNSCAPSTHPRRGNSISSTRSTPYERPRGDKPPFLQRSESSLQLSFATGFPNSIPPIQQHLASDFSTGSQFQFVDDYSTSSGSPSSRTSNQPAFPGQINVQTPQNASDFSAPLNLKPFYASDTYDNRRASQPAFLMPNAINPSGNSIPPEMYRTGSLPTNNLYPNLMPNMNLQSSDLSQLFAEDQIRDSNGLLDFSILNLSPELPHSNYNILSIPDPHPPHLWTNNLNAQDNRPLDLFASFPQPQNAVLPEERGGDTLGLTPILDQVTQLAGAGPNYLQYFSNNDTLQPNTDQALHQELNYVPQYVPEPLPMWNIPPELHSPILGCVQKLKPGGL